MQTLFAFILTLGILIVVHEWGHFIVARLTGVKVLRFSVGFGRPLWSRTRGDTEWVVAAFPLGGYVKMLDTREGPVADAEVAAAFDRQTVWKRIAIVFAGPAANLLLAIALYWVLFMIGISGIRPVVDAPPAGSPAAAAGFSAGDTVTLVGGTTVATWEDLRWELLRADGRTPIEITVADQGRQYVRLLRVDPALWNDPQRDLLERLGLTPFEPVLAPVVGRLVAGGPAERSGLQVGDRITAVGGSPVGDWKSFVKTVRAHPGKPLSLGVERAGASLPVTVLPDAIVDKGETIGRIGAEVRPDAKAFEKMRTTVRYDPISAAGRAVARTWDTAALSLTMLWHMIIGDASLKNLSGPVTIAEYAGKSLEVGIETFVAFLALVSISLGVINLLPIPLLDGGHLLYYFAEIVTRKPVSERVMAIGQRIGIAFIAVLMVFALYNDLQRLLAS